MRRAARIDRTQHAIVEALRAVGAEVTYLREPVDLAISFRGRWYMAECKSPLGPRGGSSADGQRFSASQAAWAAKQRAEVLVLRSPADALDAIGAARKPGQEARS